MQPPNKNNTYRLVERPRGIKVLRKKWVYNIKQEDGKSDPRYHASLVIKRIGQRKGVNYDKVISLVMKMTSLGMILGLVPTLNLEMEQLDVKTIFLRGGPEEDVYMELLEGFKIKGKVGMVYKLVWFKESTRAMV